MTEETTVVFHNRVVRLRAVQTIASDEWRAAITLRGELDVANAHELRAEFNAHFAAGRRVIRVDTRLVEFMDSTAIGELVRASERCQAEHGSLILTNVPRRLRRVLTVSGLDQVLLIDTAGDSRDAVAQA